MRSDWCCETNKTQLNICPVYILVKRKAHNMLNFFSLFCFFEFVLQHFTKKNTVKIFVVENEYRGDFRKISINILT